MQNLYGLRALLGSLSLTLAVLVSGVQAETSNRYAANVINVDAWDAVGRLSMRGHVFCSAVLVAPDLVLTAAHCLYRNDRRINPSKVVFKAGLRWGRSVHSVGVRRAVLHPDYKHKSRDPLRQLVADVALLELSRPVPGADKVPYETSSRVVPGRTLSVVSFSKGVKTLASAERPCAVLQRARGAIAMNCDVSFGTSGAPVFDLSQGKARIVSIVSRGTPDGKESIIFGPEIEAPLARLYAELRDGRGVFPEVARLGTERLDLAARHDEGGPVVLP